MDKGVELVRPTNRGFVVLTEGEEGIHKSEEVDDYVVVPDKGTVPIYPFTQISVKENASGTESALLGWSSSVIALFTIEVSRGRSSWVIQRKCSDVTTLHASLALDFPDAELHYTPPSASHENVSWDSPRRDLERYLREVLASKAGCDQRFESFLTVNDYDGVFSQMLPPLKQLPRELLMSVLCHLEEDVILKLSFCSKFLRAATGERSLWEARGFRFLSPSCSLGLVPRVVPATPLVTLGVHGPAAAQSQLAVLFQLPADILQVHEGEAAVGELTVRVGHSLVRLRLVPGSEPFVDARVVVCSSLEEGGDHLDHDEDKDHAAVSHANAHTRPRPGAGPVALLRLGAGEEPAGEVIAALHALLSAIVTQGSPPPDGHDHPTAPASSLVHRGVDTVATVQLAAKVAASALVFLPFKVAPAVIIFGVLGGYGVPVWILNSGVRAGALVGRAVWAYPYIAACTGSVWGLLLAGPSVEPADTDKRW
eukprot:CAMPEP_0114552916 /NCGR_PEP_ID=MMETSP0114-20121206/7376_1 /TAXON_ID=31324 /ORGANISM="Goniomonas sp, Strain m" /LENGTH=481 /DNA_ID=CAMNT_0001737817 /DNA_START=26 /DNA_END=1468 /DNA_ORIENTATION=+